MPKIEPVRCVCGRRPEIHEYCGDESYVYCNGRGGRCCWTGPTRFTTYNAIKAWNRVMTAAKEVKDAPKERRGVDKGTPNMEADNG